MWLSILLSLLALVGLGHCQTVVQQTCPTNMQMTNVGQDTNVIIGGLFEIRGMSTNGLGCGQPLSDTMQVFEAARYAVDILNRQNNGNGYIPGVKFGLNAYDTCSSTSNAVNELQRLFPQSTSSSPYCMLNNSMIAGVIGTLSSMTTVSVATLAGQLPVSIISPASTAPELSDKIKYPTFLRTVPSYAVYAKTIVELLKQLQWENVLVIYTDELYGRSGYEQLLMAMYINGLCVSRALALDVKGNKDVYKAALNTTGTMKSSIAVLMAPNSLTKIILQAVDEIPSLYNMQWILSDIDITNDVNSLRRVIGAIVVVPRSLPVDDFRQYFTQKMANPWNNAGNPWFKDWFETTYRCSQAANNCPSSTVTTAQFVQSPWAVSAMKAVFVYAETIRTICPNSVSGLCTDLTSMNSTEFNKRLFALNFNIPSTFPVNLNGQVVKFDVNGDPDTSGCTIYNYNNRGGSFKFEEIGYYESNVFTLGKQPLLYDSLRSNVITPNPTATCAALGCGNCVFPRSKAMFRFKPGDLIIASLINAHDLGSAPFSCGTGRASHLASLVATEWAVSQYKINNTNRFQQVSLGSLVVDVCPDAAVAQGFVTDLLSGNDRFMDDSRTIIPYKNIQAFVDQTSSDQVKTISPIISNYKIPEVLTSVTTSMVSNGGDTPYFTRVVPSDKILYSAISSLLQSLRWKYVQVATRKSDEYMEMAETFTKVAASYGICVVKTVNYFGDGLADSYNRAALVLSSNQETKIVVVFGNMMDVRELLAAVGQKGLNSQLQLIVGTDNWARKPSYLQGIDATGAIFVDLELYENADFSLYLQSLKQADISVNPFLRELFEITNQCSMDSNSHSTYTRKCNSTDTFSNVYLGRTPYIIKSINTVADKLHELIEEVCSKTYSGLCSAFYSASDIGSRLSGKLTNILKSNGFGTKNGESTTDVLFYVYNQNILTQFAQFNTESQTLISVNTNTLLNYQNKLSTCTGVCMSCQYLFKLQTRIYHPGDWIIAGAFGVSNSGPPVLQPYICGDVRTANGPQFTFAMMYALQQVNAGKAPVSVKGVRFGDLILDHCTNPERANLMVSDIYAEFMDQMDVDNNKILAWITDTNESTNETVQILNSLSVSTVSPSAESDGLMKYPTFFRTIQGNAAIVTALIKIVKALKMSYIQVVYSASAYGQEQLNLLTAASQSERICIVKQIPFSTNTSTIVTQLLEAQANVVIIFLDESDTDALLTSIVNNASSASSKFLVLLPKFYKQIIRKFGSSFTYPIIGLQLQKFNLSDYNDYISSSPISNPFFAQYYMKVMGCNVAGGYSSSNTACTLPLKPITSDSSYEEDEYVLSTINAVYSIVDALHRTISDYCGSDYTTPCGNFLGASDKRIKLNQNLNNVYFVDDGRKLFRFLNREGSMTYDILQSTSAGNYTKIGYYSGQSLDLAETAMQIYTTVQSTCVGPCLGCVLRVLDFSFTQGDVYIAGIFDVHDRYLTPFTCGNIKTLHGFLLLEAFHYAIEQVNAKKGQFAGILQGTRLGGVGLDECESAIRGGYIISSIHSRGVTLVKESNKIDPSEIDAYIGTYSSTGSIYIARILSDLKIPQISYGAGSQDLSEAVYPYFYRTVPTDNDQVEAMLKLLDKLNIRYVQVLYEDNSNGVSSMKHFVEIASNYNVCVAATVPYPDTGNVISEVSSNVVSKLTVNPTANTIVTFLSTNFINSLLITIGMSDKAKDKFRFVGSNYWADNQDAIQGAGSQSVGSVTVGLDADDVEDFENYINSKNLANSKSNPWFEEFFQRIMNCYISKADTKGYPIPCSDGQVNLINSQRYQQDSDVVYVINAVYAAAFAIHKTLTDVCGVNYTTVCQAYYSVSNRQTRIRDNLANVSFTDPVGKNFQFINRAGVASYRFFSINSVNTGIIGYSYAQIGSYNKSTDMVSLYNPYIWYNSDCNRPDACTECPAIRNKGLHFVFHKSFNYRTKNKVPTIVAFFDIHKQGIDPYRCGNINVAGFQQFLAFFYTLEKYIAVNGINNKYRILAIDTCSNSMRIDQDLFRLLTGAGLCDDDASLISVESLGGVITVGELNTDAASRILEPIDITYLSPNALSTWLDDKKHLVRTIAPISAMMKTLATLLSNIGWNYVDVVYEDSQEGVDKFNSFASFANLAIVCKGSNLMVPAGSMDSDVQNLLSRLNGNMGSKAVILLGSYNFFKRVLTVANAMSIANHYIWILGLEEDLTSSFYMEVVPVGVELHFITVKRLRNETVDFKTYVNGLTYSQVHTNNDVSVPAEWFDEFYQLMFDCSLSNAAKPVNIGKMMCNTTMTLSSLNWTQDMYILNTIAATYAVMNGLNNCGDICSFPLNATSRKNILSSILNVQWPDFNLQFDKDNRWWDAGFEIKYIRVNKMNNEILNMKEDKLFSGYFSPTDTQVSYMKSVLNTTSACNLGEKEACGCTFENIANPQPIISKQFKPSEPRNYYRYNDKGEKQYNWPIWAIVIAILTSVGLLIAIILFLILIFAYPVKGGTSVLGYMTIIGIIGIYVINFAFFVNANDGTCGARRFVMGVVYMIAIAPLLIKAIDTWRFGYNISEKQKYSGISSPFALFLAAIAIVLVQCIIPIIWLILVHPTATQLVPSVDNARHDNWWCDPTESYDTGLVQSFIFVMFIILLTAIFSAMSFDNDRNNYESRWTLFSCIATAGCFLVWMIVSTSAIPSVRDPAVAIGNFVNATLLLLSLPLRKTVLLCRHLCNKGSDDSSDVLKDGNGNLNMYDDSYDNQMIDLNPYDNSYGIKPSEY